MAGVAAETQQDEGLPPSGAWFYKQEDAFRHEGVYMAWDKRGDEGKKFYGVFPSHAAMCAAIEQHPQPDKRFGYEIIREGRPCRAFIDLEWLCHAATPEQEDEARGDAERLMRAYIEGLKSAQDGRVVVLDGTRRVTVTAAKAKKENVYDAWVQNLGDGGHRHHHARIECLKFSYHIIVLDATFPSVAHVKRFVEGIPPPPALDVRWRPLNLKNVPDMSIYTKNRVFRMLLCSKRSEPQAQLQFARSLTDSTDALDCMVSCFPYHTEEEEDHTQQEKREGKKRKRGGGGGCGGKRQKTAQPPQPQQEEEPRILAMRNVCQQILVEYGDTQTKVCGLHRVDGENLWFECRNQGQRSCLLGNTVHTHNQFLLWLEPPMRLSLLGATPTYDVKYQCPSAECGGAIGTIAQLTFDREEQVSHTLRFPPVLQPSPRRPACFCRRTLPLPSSVFASAPPPAAEAEVEEDEDEDDDESQQQEVYEIVEGLLTYREELCTILQSLSNALDHDFSSLWLRYSLHFGYYKASTQLDMWQRSAAVAWGKDRLDMSLAELRRLHREDNPQDKASLTYEHVARIIQHRYGLCFFTGQAVYARRQRNKADHSMERRLTYLNKEKLSALLASEVYYETSEDDEGQLKPMRFLDRWVRDPNKEQWESVDVDPSEGRLLSRFTYNLWSGFDVEKIRPNNYHDGDGLGDASALIRKHIFEVMANESQPIYEFIMDYMAHLLYKPYQRTDVLWFMFGEQGAGKSFITDLLRGLMGEQSYMESNKPEHELFSKHGHGWLSKIVVHIEEAKDLKRFHNNLKNLVTAKYLEYEEKFQSTKTAANYTNLIITANSMNAIFVPHDDRRCFAIRASSRYIQNEAYFQRLFASIQDPHVLRDFYDYCGQRDLSKYKKGMQSFIPKTDFFNECVSLNLSTFYKFLSAYVERELAAASASAAVEPIKTVMAKAFATELNDFETFNHVDPTPAVKITRKLKELASSGSEEKKDGETCFTLKHLGGCSKYIFHLPKLKERMLAKRLFDSEASF